MTIKLTSTGFGGGQPIPAKFTCVRVPEKLSTEERKTFERLPEMQIRDQ